MHPPPGEPRGAVCISLWLRARRGGGATLPPAGGPGAGQGRAGRSPRAGHGSGARQRASRTAAAVGNCTLPAAIARVIARSRQKGGTVRPSHVTPSWAAAMAALIKPMSQNPAARRRALRVTARERERREQHPTRHAAASIRVIRRRRDPESPAVASIQVIERRRASESPAAAASIRVTRSRRQFPLRRRPHARPGAAGVLPRRPGAALARAGRTGLGRRRIASAPRP